MEVERHFDDRLTPLEMFVRNFCVDARDAPAHNSIAHFESLEVGEDGKYLYLLKAQKILLTSEFILGSTLFSDLTFAMNFLPVSPRKQQASDNPLWKCKLPLHTGKTTKTGI